MKLMNLLELPVCDCIDCCFLASSIYALLCVFGFLYYGLPISCSPDCGRTESMITHQDSTDSDFDVKRNFQQNVVVYLYKLIFSFNLYL